jgi:chemotaxis protein methyltransferase CheR
MYFDAATKEDVVRRLRRALAGDGYLVVGAAETLEGLQSGFDRQKGMLGARRPVRAMGG